MAQTDQQRTEAARELVKKMFLETNATATLNLDDVKAAIVFLDNAMDALPSAFNQTKTIKQNLALGLPEPFKSIATTEQKGLAMAIWAMKEVGLI